MLAISYCPGLLEVLQQRVLCAGHPRISLVWKISVHVKILGRMSNESLYLHLGALISQGNFLHFLVLVFGFSNPLFIDTARPWSWLYCRNLSSNFLLHTTQSLVSCPQATFEIIASSTSSSCIQSTASQIHLHNCYSTTTDPVKSTLWINMMVWLHSSVSWALRIPQNHTNCHPYQTWSLTLKLSEFQSFTHLWLACSPILHNDYPILLF